MSLWWLEKGWTEALCGDCGAKIWPEGDPDWGYCYSCFTRRLEDKEHYKREGQKEVEFLESRRK